METVDVYTERGDLVTCSDCGKVMLLPYGADRWSAGAAGRDYLLR